MTPVMYVFAPYLGGFYSEHKKKKTNITILLINLLSRWHLPNLAYVMLYRMINEITFEFVCLEGQFDRFVQYCIASVSCKFIHVAFDLFPVFSICFDMVVVGAPHCY